jgi:hypothetical protein
MSPHHIDAVSRCRLLQFLAASPLFARDVHMEEKPERQSCWPSKGKTMKDYAREPTKNARNSCTASLGGLGV